MTQAAQAWVTTRIVGYKHLIFDKLIRSVLPNMNIPFVLPPLYVIVPT